MKITGYNTKTKQKEREMKDVVIQKMGNRYMAKGKDAETGDSMSVFMGEAKAMEAIKSGAAKKGDGWN